MELAWLGNLIDVDKFDQRADFNLRRTLIFVMWPAIMYPTK